VTVVAQERDLGLGSARVRARGLGSATEMEPGTLRAALAVPRVQPVPVAPRDPQGRQVRSWRRELPREIAEDEIPLSCVAIRNCRFVDVDIVAFTTSSPVGIWSVT